MATSSDSAVFLAVAAVPLGDAPSRRAALGAIRHALGSAARIPPDARDGLYSGWIGVAYAALRVAALLDDDEIREGGRALLALPPPRATGWTAGGAGSPPPHCGSPPCSPPTRSARAAGRCSRAG